MKQVWYLCLNNKFRKAGFVFPNELDDDYYSPGFFVIESSEDVNRFFDSYIFWAVDKGKFTKTILNRNNKGFIVDTGKYGEFHFEAIFAPTPMNRYVGVSTDVKEIKSKLYILKCSDIEKLEKVCREYDFYFIGNNGFRHENRYNNLL